MPQLNTTISQSTHIMLERLVKNLGYTKRLVIELAVREFYQSESTFQKETQMSQETLFDLFVGGQASTADIAQMDVDTIAVQIGEMRADDPDDLPMTDQEIAQDIAAFSAQQ